MTTTKTTKPGKDGAAGAYTQSMASEGVANALTPLIYLGEPVGEGIITPMQQTGGSVTSLSSAAITNPTPTFARPSSAVSSAVTATNANPCVFTWTAHPLVNGQQVVLGGTTAPVGFTLGINYFVVAKAANTFQLAATFGGGSIGSTSTGTAVTATLVYGANTLIANTATAGSVSVPTFVILNTAGGAFIPRIRVLTNAPGTLSGGSYIGSGWDGVNISVNMWSAAPTFGNGDAQPYAVATGYANWLANFQATLTQFGDGAAGTGTLTGGSQATVKLPSTATIYFDMQMVSPSVVPIFSQTMAIIPELIN